MKRPGGNLARTARLSPSPLKPGSGSLPRTGWTLARRSGIRPVSAARARENRQRRAMVTALYPEQPRCARPGCPRMADDLHEPLTRARGGSITDPDNQKPLCRPCHDEVTFRPESELGWAYDCGLLIHSWDAGKPGDAA